MICILSVAMLQKILDSDDDEQQSEGVEPKKKKIKVQAQLVSGVLNCYGLAVIVPVLILLTLYRSAFIL